MCCNLRLNEEPALSDWTHGYVNIRESGVRFQFQLRFRILQACAVIFARKRGACIDRLDPRLRGRHRLYLRLLR